jgi:hypothetical protein
MTGIYKTGTITLNSNSNIVTGDGTLFQTVANAREGDLFTLNGESFYEIYQVDTETQLRIRNLVTGVKYQGPSVTGVNYAIVRNFAASADAQIASDVVNLQQRWHQREREMTEWFASDANYHQITDIRGDKVLVITPTGLNNLVDGPVNIEDFGFPSAKESQALDLNDFPAGIFYTRPLSIAHQPPGFGSGIKLVITNKSETLFYQKIIELSTSKVRYRIATTATNAELWNTLGSEDGSGLTEVTWNDIVPESIPATALRWPSFSEISGDINSVLEVFAKRWPSFEEVTGDILPLLPETATRWPDFNEVTGTVSPEQLPTTVTANKRSLAESPPVRQNPSLTHILSDYPTLKKTIDIPTHSPNNRREFLFDDARQVAYVALTEKWLKIPTTISTRKFMVVKAGRYLRFNSAFTGDVTLRVYPMGSGGTGLPTSPTLADYQWHTVTINVTDLWTIGRDNGNYFEGIIDFVELTTASDNNWELLDSEKSKFTSLNAFFDNDYSTPKSPFDTFELRQDGYWYSQDITPDAPYSIGPSWTQDTNDPRLYHANNVTDSNDGVRFFNDAYDNYEVEMIVVADIDRPLALTASNESELTVNYSSTERFICGSRLFLKRTNSALPVTGQIRIESIRIRVPNNG